MANFKQILAQSSGCGAVGDAVASNTKDLRFESSHKQFDLLSIVNLIIDGNEWPNLKKISLG